MVPTLRPNLAEMGNESTFRVQILGSYYLDPSSPFDVTVFSLMNKLLFMKNFIILFYC